MIRQKNQEIALDAAIDMYVDLILKAKYYEDCLKASSEFEIPLVIVDKSYYFNRLLAVSELYDDETKNSILAFYLKSDENTKKEIFNMVACRKDVIQIMKTKESSQISGTF